MGVFFCRNGEWRDTILHIRCERARGKGRRELGSAEIGTVAINGGTAISFEKDKNNK
jgi:hypothetical protein